jgi:excisionase family DNA binding protein
VNHNNKEEQVEKLLFSAEEVAGALGIGRSRVYALIASGELPSVRVGKLIRVPAAALRAWLAERGQAAPIGARRSAP